MNAFPSPHYHFVAQNLTWNALFLFALLPMSLPLAFLGHSLMLKPGSRGVARAVPKPPTQGPASGPPRMTNLELVTGT